MTKLLTTLSLALALLASAPGPLAPAQTRRPEPQRAPTGEPALDAVRQRWEALPSAEKERMRERWERYQRLSQDEQRELDQRARRMRGLRESLERGMAPETRARLARLPPEQRQQILREMVEGETAKIGSRMRELLPPEVLQRLEQAKPEDRARFFADFQRRQRERVTRFALEQVGQRLDLPREEIETYKALRQEQRAQKLLELQQRLSAEDARSYGLPPGLTQEQWNAWLALSPEAFFERMQEHNRRRQLDPSAREAPATRGNEAPRLAPERARALRRLQQSMHPRPEELLELADLAPAERSAQLAARARERCLAVMREEGLVDPARIEELRALSNARFLEAVRGLLAPLRGLDRLQGPSRPR